MHDMIHTEARLVFLVLDWNKCLHFKVKAAVVSISHVRPSVLLVNGIKNVSPQNLINDYAKDLRKHAY